MKRFLICAAAIALMLPNLAQAQPGRDRPENRSDNRSGNRFDRPGDNRPGNRPGRPDRPVTLPAPVPGGPGMRPPPRPMPPAMRPPPRPQFSWRGRYYNPIRGSLFRYPPGYAYRRWSIGTFLPGLFLGSSYYYDDWRMLGIDRPPPGRRWVRYGPDLLLVNLRNRRVEDVIYNVFY